eukprot:311547-Hanusia_phi.AAC.1
MAPELIDPPSIGDRRVSHKSDMYSFGVTMVEFLQERQRGGADNNAIDSLMVGLEGHAKDLALKLLNRDPVRRYSSAEALTHSFFTHSMIQEREVLDRQRIEMLEDHDRQLAVLVNRQEGLVQEEQVLHSKKEALRKEATRLLAEQKELLSKGKHLEHDAKMQQERLHKQKEDLCRQESALKRQQQELQGQVQGLRKEQVRLERERQKVETDKLLLAHDRVVLNPPLYWQQSSPGGIRKVKIDVTTQWQSK